MVRIRPSVGLLVLFVLLLGAALFSQRPAPAQSYDPESNRVDGLLLLREWLREMGYGVASTDSHAFALGQADMLFVYPGERPFVRQEGDLLVEWVENGGTLVLVAPADGALTRRFGFSSAVARGGTGLQQLQPLLPNAPGLLAGDGFARRLSLPDDSPAVAVLAEKDDATEIGLAVQRRGEGWVWLLASDFALTNGQLTGNRASAQILPALLRTVPTGGAILFDTYHLTLSAGTEGDGRIRSIQDWLYTTPSGWAVLLLFGLGFGFLLLQGRRLGPALPTITQGRRREAAEFVVAMAGLQRRARVRASVAQHQRHRLKQGLGRPWQVPANLPDDEFVARLAEADPSVDVQRLRSLLAALAQASDEESLVALAQQVDALLMGG